MKRSYIVAAAVIALCISFLRASDSLPVIEPPPIPWGVNHVEFDSDLAGKYRMVIFDCDSLLVGHFYELYYPSREKLSLVTVSTNKSGFNVNVEFSWSEDSTFLYFHEIENGRRGICYRQDSIICCYSIFGRDCMLAREYDVYFEKMRNKYEMLLPDTLDVHERANYYP